MRIERSPGCCFAGDQRRHLQRQHEQRNHRQDGAEGERAREHSPATNREDPKGLLNDEAYFVKHCAHARRILRGLRMGVNDGSAQNASWHSDAERRRETTDSYRTISTPRATSEARASSESAPRTSFTVRSSGMDKSGAAVAIAFGSST